MVFVETLPMTYVPGISIEQEACPTVVDDEIGTVALEAVPRADLDALFVIVPINEKTYNSIPSSPFCE